MGKVIRIKSFWVLILGLLVITAINLVQFIAFNYAKDLITASAGQRIIPIYSVEVPDKRLSISFDATWGAGYTDDLLDMLDRQGVKATFFLAGYWLEKYPDYVKKIASRGHEIGNHSYTHPHMNSLAEQEIRNELNRTSDLIESLTGARPKLFRPPFGEYSNKVIIGAKECGMETIQWDVDSLDWQNTTVDAIVNRVMGKAKPGSIILFHNNGTHTVKAAEIIITRLKSQGYTIQPISELILKGEFYVDHTGRQRPKTKPAMEVI